MCLHARTPDAAESKELSRWLKRPRQAVQMRRGQLISLSAQGMRVQELSATLHLHEEYIRTLVRRYNEEGLASLRTRVHPGRTPTLTPEDESVVVEIAKMPPRAFGQPFNQGSLRKLTDGLVGRQMIPKVSQVTIGKVLDRHKVTCQRTRTWKESKDPDFSSKKTHRPTLPGRAEGLGRSLLRRNGAGADQAPCRLLMGAAEAPGATPGHLHSARWRQLFLRRLQRPRGRPVDASQAKEARLGGAHLPQGHPAPVSEGPTHLPRFGQFVDPHDRTDPPLVSAKSSLPRLHRYQRLLDEPSRMPSYGRPLLRHQKQRPRGPSRRRPAHAGVPRMEKSKPGQCEARQGPKFNADSLTAH